MKMSLSTGQVVVNQWDVIKIAGTGEWVMCLGEDKSTYSAYSVTYNFKTLNLSKWRLIRKLQIRIIKKAFK